MFFYIATDDRDELKNLEDRYGDRIISYREKTWGRDTPEAIKDALIDILCLSRCTKIIGSSGSGFSLVAAGMGDIELIIP